MNATAGARDSPLTPSIDENNSKGACFLPYRVETGELVILIDADDQTFRQKQA